MDTYVSHNGKSTTDLIFCNMKGMNIAYQRTLRCMATTPICKHIPIKTIFTLRPAHTVRTEKRIIHSRNLDICQMVKASDKINHILQAIKDGHLNNDEERIGTFIRQVAAPQMQRQRRAKSWFDVKCHTFRATTLKLLHQARKTPNREGLHRYMISCRDYKSLIREKDSQ
jgi:hypothetical protein